MQPSSERIFWEDLTEGMPLPCRAVSFDRHGIVAFSVPKARRACFLNEARRTAARR